MDDFTAYYASLLDGAYGCDDRIVVNAYYPLGQTPGGFRTWWRRFQRDEDLTTKRLLRLASLPGPVYSNPAAPHMQASGWVALRWRDRGGEVFSGSALLFGEGSFGDTGGC